MSELVAFPDNLFANVAGPSEDISTLFKVLSVPGDIITNKVDGEIVALKQS